MAFWIRMWRLPARSTIIGIYTGCFFNKNKKPLPSILPLSSNVLVDSTKAMNKMFLAIEQIASPIRRHRKQRLTLLGLGLNRIGRVVERSDTPEIRGMIAKVRHLVRVVRLATELEKLADAVRALYREPLPAGGKRGAALWAQFEEAVAPTASRRPLRARSLRRKGTWIADFGQPTAFAARWVGRPDLTERQLPNEPIASSSSRAKSTGQVGLRCSCSQKEMMSRRMRPISA